MVGGRGVSASARRKILSGLVVFLIGIGLLVGLFVILQAPQQPAVSSFAPNSAVAPTHASAPVPAKTIPPSPTGASEKVINQRITPAPDRVAKPSTPDGEIVAEVNGQILTRQNLRVMQATDRAMAQLLGGAPPTDADVLERLVNGELVWQAAQAAGFTVADAEVTQALAELLAGQRRSLADLERALSASGLSSASFNSYFGRLVTIDRFAQRQAQNRTVTAYVGALQANARISFGPAAQLAMTTATAVAASPTPRPTLTAAPPPQTALPAPTPIRAAVRGIEAGQLAPDFSLPALMYFVTNATYTETASLQLADLVGKPAVLSFWTTWCPYCRAQTPNLVAAYQRYGPERVRFLGVDVKEAAPVVQEYLRANGVTYPIGLDTDGQVAAAYHVTGYPTTYFLDAAGRIVARHTGQLSAEQIAGYLAALAAR